MATLSPVAETPFRRGYAALTQAEKIRRLGWIYIILLFAEGPLRKWGLPPLQQPLLIVRDPIAFLMILEAWKGGYLRNNRYIKFVLIFGFVSTVVSFVVSEQLLTTIYGFRTSFLHLPVPILMGMTMTPQDLRKIYRLVMVMIVINAPIIFLQYNSPVNSWINAGQAENFIQITNSNGVVRPAGIFSYNTGPECLGGLALAFFLSPPPLRTISDRILLGLGGVAFATTLVFSGNRSYFLLCGIVIVTVVFVGGLLNTQSFRRTAPIVFLGLLIAFLFSLIPQVSDSLSLFYEARFVSPSRGDVADGGLTVRIIDIFTQPFTDSGNQPAFGHGLGIGTQAGAQLAGVNIYTYGDAEGDILRHVIESGYVLGYLYVFFRFGTVALIMARGFMSSRHGSLVPLTMAALASTLILTYPLGQPTILGFTVVVVAISLLAERFANLGPEAYDDPVVSPA